MQNMLDHPVLLIILSIVNIPIYIVLMGAFFGELGGLIESIRYWSTPDIISAFRGEFIDGQWAKLKLGFYIGLCALTIAAEYTAISKFMIWIQT